MQYIAPLAKLIEHFRALPGTGNKTAVRLAYHVIDMDTEKAKALAAAIIDAKEKIGYCNTCFNLSDANPCAICGSDQRDHSVICVVEQPQDVAAMERMRDYHGVYLSRSCSVSRRHRWLRIPSCPLHRSRRRLVS